MKKDIYIIKTGTTFPGLKDTLGDFDLWTLNSMGLGIDDVIITDAEHGDPLPFPGACTGVVITGSHSMVTEHLQWSEDLLKWIPEIIDRKVPFMGICYGHQLLAQAMGGEVGYHLKGKEIGTVKINLLPESEDDPLFGSMTSGFYAHVTHSQSIITPPDCAVTLACNDFEQHHAIRIGPCAWGLQFHPEYSTDIMKSYILNQADELEKAGHDTAELVKGVRETAEASETMKIFTGLIMKRQ